MENEINTEYPIEKLLDNFLDILSSVIEESDNDFIRVKKLNESYMFVLPKALLGQDKCIETMDLMYVMGAPTSDVTCIVYEVTEGEESNIVIALNYNNPDTNTFNDTLDTWIEDKKDLIKDEIDYHDLKIFKRFELERLIGLAIEDHTTYSMFQVDNPNENFWSVSVIPDGDGEIECVEDLEAIVQSALSLVEYKDCTVFTYEAVKTNSTIPPLMVSIYFCIEDVDGDKAVNETDKNKVDQQPV